MKPETYKKAIEICNRIITGCEIAIEFIDAEYDLSDSYIQESYLELEKILTEN